MNSGRQSGLVKVLCVTSFLKTYFCSITFMWCLLSHYFYKYIIFTFCLCSFLTASSCFYFFFCFFFFLPHFQLIFETLWHIFLTYFNCFSREAASLFFDPITERWEGTAGVERGCRGNNRREVDDLWWGERGKKKYRSVTLINENKMFL